jgi:hypothetical protein
VQRAIQRCRRRTGAPSDPRRVAESVDRILYRLPSLWHHTCLRRATVIALLLRRDGRNADVVLGVRRGASGKIEAHAWLRCDGVEPFLGSADDVNPYARLTRPIAALEPR